MANFRGINHLVVVVIIIIKDTHKYAKWRKPPSCFCKNGGIGHALYFKASFHTNEILNESHRHLEFWLDDILATLFHYFLYLHTKFEPNPSILGKVMAVFPKMFPKSNSNSVCNFGIVMTSLKTIRVQYLVMSWHECVKVSFE